MSGAAVVGLPTHPYSAEQVAIVQGHTDAIAVAPMTSVQRIVKTCVEQHIARYVPGLRADQFLVHEENRGKLMLDWYKMHENGHKISKAGARRSKVSKDAVAFEMGHDRAAQIAANVKLVQHASGHMAPVTNTENFVSVAGSHFSQFVKAAMAGCKTPIKGLQDGNGKLNKQALCGECEYFEDLAESGWEWLIFPANARIAWPKLADFLQFAYNAGV